MAKIKEITASEILNSRGLPAVEASVLLSDGKTGIASCPMGQTIANYEALDLRDQDQNRFEGQGVLKAMSNIKNIIAPGLIGKEAERQQELDKIMIDLDGTQNKSRLGANAILAVSMAIAKAGAQSSVLPLFLYLREFIKKDRGFLKIPVPIFNLIEGGNKENTLPDFHEFLIIPASSKPYTESIQIGENINKYLKKILESKTSSFTTNREAFSLMQQAVESAHLRLGFDVFFGLNSKASAFYKDGKYRIKDSPTALSSKDFVSYYEELNKDIHLLYLEDPLDQNDWEGWTLLFEKLSQSSIIAGGDLIATNPYRLQMALSKKTVNGIVVKPTQVGTVIESLAIAEAAKETGIKTIVSHREIETNDDFISDFAVAVGADYVEIGNLANGENIAKYNRLLQIENHLKLL